MVSPKGTDAERNEIAEIGNGQQAVEDEVRGILTGSGTESDSGSRMTERACDGRTPRQTDHGNVREVDQHIERIQARDMTIRASTRRDEDLTE